MRCIVLHAGFDIDGSGPTDLVYLGREGVQIWSNHAGNRFGDGSTVAGFGGIDDAATVSVADLLANQDVFGFFAGRGWEWVTGGYLLGGLWLWQRGIISWHAPLSFIAGLSLVAGGLWLYDPLQFANPIFHLFSGGAMLGAFFIVTDPVSGCTTARGKLIFGFSAGMLALVIRVFGGYPDGVAFAVLLMNICVPLIDLYTQPAIFGMKDKP